MRDGQRCGHVESFRSISTGFHENVNNGRVSVLRRHVQACGLRKEGRKEGKTEGRKTDGQTDGRTEGRKEKKEGRREGRKEGS